MILITGAAGKTGKSVVRRLAKQGGVVRALVFRPDQILAVEALGAQDIHVGDMREEIVIQKAMQGVESVYHICPNMHPDEIEIGQVMIDRAASKGVAHFVYHSVLHPQIESMPHHWAKMRVEERLFESRLPYTILQPAVYMQNILVNWDTIIGTGLYTIPYAAESRISMVDLEDVALSAALVLMDGCSDGKELCHHDATYELVGTRAMSQTEVAETLSKHLDQPVRVESVPRIKWRRDARASGLSAKRVESLLKMFEYYEKYGFVGNSRVLTWLLDRPATSFDAFVQRIIEQRSPVPQ